MYLVANNALVPQVRAFIHGSGVQAAGSVAEFDPLFGSTPPDPTSDDLSMSARGQLRVQRILYGAAAPHVSIVPCATGSIQQDVNFFLAQSDQTPGHIHLTTSVNSDATVEFAGGVFAQLLAGGDPGVLDRVASALEGGAVDLTAMHASGEGLHHAAAALLPELELGTDSRGLPSVMCGGVSVRDGPPDTAAGAAAAAASPAVGVPVGFLCRCSKAGFLSKVATLPAADIQAMASEVPPPTLTCHFCNEPHSPTKEELEALLPPQDTHGNTDTSLSAGATGGSER